MNVSCTFMLVKNLITYNHHSIFCSSSYLCLFYMIWLLCSVSFKCTFSISLPFAYCCWVVLFLAQLYRVFVLLNINLTTILATDAILCLCYNLIAPLLILLLYWILSLLAGFYRNDPSFFFLVSSSCLNLCCMLFDMGFELPGTLTIVFRLYDHFILFLI